VAQAARRDARAVAIPVREKDVLSAVLELLAVHPRVAFAYRQNVGGFYNAAGQYVACGFAGCADIIGMMKDGRYLAIEVKGSRGKASEEQLAFIFKVRNNGGVGLIAYAVDDLVRGLQDA